VKLTKIVVVLALSALAVAATACGDEEQDTQSREELITTANAKCDQFEDDLQTIDRPRGTRGTRNASLLNDYYGTLAGVYEARYVELKALDPGEDTENAWRPYIAKERERSDVANRIAEKLAKGDRSALNDAQELNRLDQEVSDEARAVGANVCARRLVPGGGGSA
jgi:hypothetical protein